MRANFHSVKVGDELIVNDPVKSFVVMVTAKSGNEVEITNTENGRSINLNKTEFSTMDLAVVEKPILEIKRR